MQTFYLSDKGNIREHNEDSVMITKNKKNEYLMAVADGMGGHRAGEIAATIATSYLKENFEELNTIGEKMDAVAWLKKEVKRINDAIYDYADSFPDSKGLGTTLVVSILTDEFLIFGNIGDSAGYVIKDEEIHKVTHDHTLVNLLRDTGELTEEEARNHPKKNVLMKALGANNPIEIDIFDVDTDVDLILLCSDGLTNLLTDEQIEKVLIEEIPVDEKVNKLIKKTINRGGTDNVSIAILERKESGDACDNKGSENQ